MEDSKKSNGKTLPANLLEENKVDIEEILAEYKHFDFSNLKCKTIDMLKERDPEAKSWKQKLELISAIVNTVELEDRELAAIGGYLQLINNGQIKCNEGGGHYRPNHHANISLDLYKFLIPKTNNDNSFLIRTILKSLPSFSTKFLCSVPLTRIRDIAHRNDIPGDLKREIKVTLQNKLHRNAGPEDLVTAQNILDKVYSNGSYPQAFVQEFEKFMDELKEFFNAMDLDQLLKMLSDALDEARNNPIKSASGSFLEAKANAHKELLNCIKALTQLRKELIQLKENSDNTSVYGYSWNADFQLEDYLFVLLGQYLSSSKSLNNDKELHNLLQIIIYGLKNMQYSDYEKEECACIEHELSKYIEITKDKTLFYLRVKTVVDRGIRLIRRLSTTIYDECQDTVSQKVN